MSNQATSVKLARLAAARANGFWARNQMIWWKVYMWGCGIPPGINSLGWYGEPQRPALVENIGRML